MRNTQGFDWHPVTKERWFTDHGRDWMGDDSPEDELNRMTRVGQNFGFPCCHANGQNPKITPFVTGFKDDATDAFSGRPAYLLQMPDGSLLLSDEQLGAIYRIPDAKPSTRQLHAYRQGNSPNPQIPSLAGQPKVFLENQLVLVREGLRDIPQMKGLLDGVKDADLTILAGYFSAQAPLRAAAGPGRDTIMSASLYGLKDSDLADLAHFLPHFKSAPACAASGPACVCSKIRPS